MKLIVPSILLALIFGAGVVSCGRSRRNPEKRTDFVTKRLARELDLTDEQQQQVRALAAEVRVEIDSRKADWESRRSEMSRQFLADELSAEDVERLIEQHAPDRESMQRLLAEKVAAFHAILTPDQRRQLVEKMDEKWQRHRRSRRPRRR